jgi:hypothetical protein
MELWLLGAGAIVLIGITLWIVWPARSADAVVGTSVQGEEVSIPMTDNVRRSMTPQGDQFEDQYTSATADLSPGGVAAAVESMQTPPSEPWPAANLDADRIGQASRSENYLRDTQPTHENRSLAQPRTIGLGAGVLLSLGGAIGGAWLYARWQRERNKPINRLRRGAHDVATRLGERMPDLDELPHGAAPLGGAAASALLLTALLGTRALRRGDSDDHTEAVREQARELLQESVREAFGRGRQAIDLGRDVVARRGEAVDLGRDMLERGRKESQRIESPRPMFMGLGFGGLAVVAGGAYVVWRLLRGGPKGGQNWYSGE